MLNFILRLFGFRTERGPSDKELIDAGVCPNCWGVSQYGDKYKEYLKDRTKANISGAQEHDKAFINQFVETYVTGIKLKKNKDKMSCPNCGNLYQVRRSGTDAW